MADDFDKEIAEHIKKIDFTLDKLYRDRPLPDGLLDILAAKTDLFPKFTSLCKIDPQPVSPHIGYHTKIEPEEK
jgi:hypothetical protein